ncbi:MAG: hypothetical protein AUK47_01145 [Deltaproteobacteria bacterium CG2_30_63_29]|nr:MAG: hypothetical protein AUK47_01145 [Deltaproteobacteria bacterium CG2_30_63_29]PIW00095.1 MAG: hypothetical protein COW42_08870 [Deltaproteobacteria bacterium CG17_big_fil_post_rev_8_21_14_2_50_63_7]PJB43268.1 MAG: hypothetical protein CO108_10420 [Deltaproteobacteria bacterium CG_4_9_14_3_um_filter_63_12]
MKNVLIGVAVAIAVIALIVFIYVKMKAVTERAAAISEDVIARYVGLLQSRKYEEAYDTCLSDGFKKKWPKAEFVAAHQARVDEFGALQGWKENDYQHEANLFTSESLIGFNGILSYANREVFVLYKVDSAIQPYLIMEIAGSIGTSTSLSQGIW